MELAAFFPQGLTKLVAASSSTSVAATQVSTENGAGMLLSNPSTVAVYVAIGSSAVQAAQPTTAAPAEGLCLPNGTMRWVSIKSSSDFGWVSAVTSAGTAAPGLFATPGQGL